jgi:heptose-I-phosphate ethanolaminephosphotransferase
MLVSIFGIVDFVVLSLENPAFSNVRYWDITLGQYKQYNEFMEKIASEKDVVNLNKDYNDFYKKDTASKTIVLVISESLSKGHMSLYGYGRRTTPFLDHSTGVIKFNDCVTPATLTSDAVPYLFYNDYNSKEINLIPLLNKLGYETSWISNQAGWGRRDGAIVLLSQLCGTTVFNHALSADDESNWSLHYDEEILDDFEKILSNNSRKSKFIVLHFMGCHFDYEKRYPTNRNYFTNKPDLKLAVNSDKAINIINSYDNAVLYHDSVINCVLKSVTKYSNEKHENTALIFLSDHGEELYENRDYIGHAYPPSKIMSEVPYFMYLSDDFKKNYPAIDLSMKNRVNTPYSTKNNFYSITHLLNIGSEKYNDQILKNSFLSSSYDSTYTRYVMGMDYKNL